MTALLCRGAWPKSMFVNPKPVLAERLHSTLSFRPRTLIRRKLAAALSPRIVMGVGDGGN